MRSIIKKIIASFVILTMILTLLPTTSLKVDAANTDPLCYIVRFSVSSNSIVSENSIYLTYHNDTSTDSVKPYFPGSLFTRPTKEILSKLGFSEDATISATNSHSAYAFLFSKEWLFIKGEFMDETFTVTQDAVETTVHFSSKPLKNNVEWLTALLNQPYQMVSAYYYYWDEFLYKNGIPFANSIYYKDEPIFGDESILTFTHPKFINKKLGKCTFTATISAINNDIFGNIPEISISTEINVVNPIYLNLNGGTVHYYDGYYLDSIFPGTFYIPITDYSTYDGKLLEIKGFSTNPNSTDPEYEPGVCYYLKDSTTLYAIFDKPVDKDGNEYVKAGGYVRMDKGTELAPNIVPVQNAFLSINSPSFHSTLLTNESGYFELYVNQDITCNPIISYCYTLDDYRSYLFEDYDITRGKLDHDIFIDRNARVSTIYYDMYPDSYLELSGINAESEALIGSHKRIETIIECYSGDDSSNSGSPVHQIAKYNLSFTSPKVYYYSFYFAYLVSDVENDIYSSPSTVIREFSKPLFLRIKFDYASCIDKLAIIREFWTGSSYIYNTFTQIDTPNPEDPQDSTYYYDPQTKLLYIWANKFSDICVVYEEHIFVPEPSFALIPSSTTLTKANETASISIDGLKEDSYSYITWSSSDPSVASVDENGVVTAHSDGTVTITAVTSDERSASTTISVKISDSADGDKDSKDKKDSEKDNKDKEKKPGSQDDSSDSKKIASDAKPYLDRLSSTNKPLLSLVSKSVKKNGKDAIKVEIDTSSLSPDIKALLEKGYRLETDFYRGDSKNANSMEKMYSTSNLSYTNTFGDKGARYYYRAVVKVLDPAGNCVYESKLENCKYAKRLW